MSPSASCGTCQAPLRPRPDRFVRPRPTSLPRHPAVPDHIHSHQQDKRHGSQHQAGRVRSLGVKALDSVVDVERRGLGLADQVARDDQHGAEFAERAGDRQRHAVGHAPANRRQRDAPERPPAAGPERVGRLLAFLAELAQDRHQLADHERHRHEQRRQDHPGHRVDHLETRFARARGPASPRARTARPASARQRPAKPRTASRRCRPRALGPRTAAAPEPAPAPRRRPC